MGSTPFPKAGLGAISYFSKDRNAGLDMNYAAYLPEGYETKATWPVMIFLHGRGECEKNGASVETSATKNGPLREMKVSNFGLPMIVLAPQESSTSCYWKADAIEKFIDYARDRYRIDSKRLYVAGLSLGGGGVAQYLSSYSDRVAAAFSICPGYGYNSGVSPSAPSRILGNGVPLWTAVAANENVANPEHSFNLVTSIWRLLGWKSTNSALRGDYPGSTSTAYFDDAANVHRWVSGQDYRAGGRDIVPPYLITYYPTGGHAIWDEFFSDQKVYDWLLKHSL